MQVGIDNEEPGREAKNETTKKIIFIKIPNVQNDNEDINMNSNVNSNVHMQSQSQLQRSINKPKKSIIPYEKPPAVFLPTEKPFITNDNSNSNYLSTPHNSVYKPQSPSNNEDEIISSSIDNNKHQQQHSNIKHVLSLDEHDLNNKPQLNSSDDNILDNISCSLVWTSIPVLSYIFPFIGHVGITDSTGRIHDFGSSHYISIDQMTYGNPDKIIHFEITNDEFTRWDKCIHSVSKKFTHKTYSLCGVNGYSFCASVLNKINYNDRNDYTACEVMKMTIGCKYYVGTASMCKSYIGLIIIIVLIILVIILCTS